MSSVVITIENLGKKYLLTHQGEGQRYAALRDVIAEKARHLFDGSLARKAKGTAGTEDFWALKGLSLEIKQGQVVGIIGHNGAGKTTLLKILSRITEPTTGRVRLRGRVASLLEVGTGFHPELTGRENIYLNGAILGMTRVEIRRKFDEIVAFAEVERFLDTPVKRYSSGMYVRLAFAVAAHLEPEILIVDEVLAVGDAQFQKKCLGKMNEVRRSGRTVLFVSHNMSAIEQLCSHAMILNRGELATSSSDVRGVIKRHLVTGQAGGGTIEWVNSGTEYGNPYFTPLRFWVSNCDDTDRSGTFSNDTEIWVHIEGRINTFDPALNIGYALYTEDALPLFWSFYADPPEEDWIRLEAGVCHIRAPIPRRLLNQGTFRVELLAALHMRAWILEPAVKCPVIHLTVQGGLSNSPLYMAARPTLLAPIVNWGVVKSTGLMAEDGLEISCRSN